MCVLFIPASRLWAQLRRMTERKGCHLILLHVSRSFNLLLTHLLVNKYTLFLQGEIVKIMSDPTAEPDPVKSSNVVF